MMTKNIAPYLKDNYSEQAFYEINDELHQQILSTLGEHESLAPIVDAIHDELNPSSLIEVTTKHLHQLSIVNSFHYLPVIDRRYHTAYLQYTVMIEKTNTGYEVSLSFHKNQATYTYINSNLNEMMYQVAQQIETMVHECRIQANQEVIENGLATYR